MGTRMKFLLVVLLVAIATSQATFNKCTPAKRKVLKLLNKICKDNNNNDGNSDSDSNDVSNPIENTNSNSNIANFDNLDDLSANADTIDWLQHPCRRTCSDSEPPRKCKYVFIVEELSSMGKACYDCPFNGTDCSRPHCMSADGVQKKLFVVNRRMPGPTIEVCQHDTVIVDVQNKMKAQSTTVHWHGIAQQDTPYMDGVPYVTQCPIPPGDTFRYIFKVPETGTYFWHSHMGGQRSDGFAGALIVHSPPNRNPHRHMYDVDDHRMLVADWGHIDGDSAHTREFQYKADHVPETLIVNGRGRYQPFPREGQADTFTPLAVFNVERNKRYRFRMIDAGSENCPIQLSIDNHTVMVISMDSNDIEPVPVHAITIWPGERVDFVLTTDQEPGNYWMRYRGYGRCQRNTTFGAYQTSILRYAGSEESDPTGPVAYDIPKQMKKFRVLNPYNAGTETPQWVNVSVPRLNALAKNDPSLRKVPDETHYITFDFYPLDNPEYHRKNLYGYNQVARDRRIGSLQLNHISLKLQQFPLLTQFDDIKPGMLCDWSTINHTLCKTEHCECTHVIPVKLNSVVELIFVDEGRFGVINHPLHLHGHFFRVVATENLEGNVTISRVQQLDREGKIHRRLDRAPIKDTMKAPGGGYSIVRFHANNPGYWFFHCHFEPHMHIGMALVFKVGEHKDFPKVPDNFPKCGPFLPNIM